MPGSVLKDITKNRLSLTIVLTSYIPTLKPSQMAPTERPTFSGAAKKTFQKIAIEEAISTHVFNATATLPPVNSTAELPYVDTKYVADVKDRLTNIEARVKAMDEAGVALTVVSLTMPGIEGIFDTTVAVETARKVNNEIRELYTYLCFVHIFLYPT